MDALLCGCKQLEAASRGIDCTPASTLTGEGSGATGTLSPSGGGGGGGAGPMVVIDAERSTFAINGNLVSVLQRAVADVLPPSGYVWGWRGGGADEMCVCGGGGVKGVCTVCIMHI